MAALKPVGDVVTLTTSSTSAQSAAQAHKTDTLRVVAVTTPAHIAIGTLPVATAANFYVPAGSSASISLGSPNSNRVTGITTGTTTVIDFPEGTGSPFTVGDAVSLTVEGQSDYDFSHKIVSSVNTTADVSGYFSTRIIVNNDSSTGNPGALLDTSYAELRSSFMVAALSTGSGKCYVQQVQVTGDA